MLEIRLPNMFIVLSDYKPELPLSLDIDLSLTPGSALAHLPSGHQEAVEQRSGGRFASCSVRRSISSAGSSSSQGEVRSTVDSTLRETAARVGRWRAPGDRGKPPIEGVHGRSKSRSRRSRSASLIIRIRSKSIVALRPISSRLGALVNSGEPPRQVEAWARQTVRARDHHHLLDELYVDLFDAFRPRTCHTEQALQAAAAAIGYRLTRTTLQTNLDFDVLQRGFECRIENASFPLALRECQVNLDIETRLRITDRRVLRELFKKNTGIKQTVSERIRETVAGALRQVRPEEFYLRFYGDGQSSEASARRAARRQAIQEALCAAFTPDEPLVVQTSRCGRTS